MSNTHYRIDPDDQQRLEELATIRGAGLSNEIALARCLAEKAAVKQQGSLAGALLKIVGNLAKEDYTIKERDRQLLGREVIVEFAKRLCDIMVEELDILDCPRNRKTLFADTVIHRVVMLLSDDAQAAPENQHLLRITTTPTDAKVIQQCQN
jgi:hypothetical protein